MKREHRLPVIVVVTDHGHGRVRLGLRDDLPRSQFGAECIQPFCDLLFQERCWQPKRHVGDGDCGLADLERDFPCNPASGELAVYVSLAEFVSPLHATT